MTASQITDTYGPPRKTIKYWEVRGEIIRVGTDPRTGAALYDAISVYEKVKTWKPDKDSSARSRFRTRTVTGTVNGGTSTTDTTSSSAAFAPPAAPHAAAGGNGGSMHKRTGPARAAAPTGYVIPAGTYRSQVPAGVPLRLDNKGWRALYVQANHGKWSEGTTGAHRTFQNRFIPDFPVLDFTDPLILRGQIRQWLEKLPDLVRPGEVISDGTKETYRKKIKSYLEWLNQEFDYPGVNLKDFGYKEGRGIPMEPWRTREVLKVVQDSSEIDIVNLFAQTGMRISDLITIRPECIETTADGHHYIKVWGKRTEANEVGFRLIPLPSECYRRLMANVGAYGEFSWVRHFGSKRAEIIPIGGRIEQVDRRRPIDLSESCKTGEAPLSYRVVPYPGSAQRIKDIVERLVRDAGVYVYRLGAHGWRHAYTDEWTRRGGREKYCDWMLGHLSKSDISGRYTHIPIEDLCREAEQCAPRDFLAKIGDGSNSSA